MSLSIDQRVAAARELLGEWSAEEYEALSAESKVNLQEAVDFLHNYEQSRQKKARGN
jgi:ethanolamine utilization protein EutP (predicted NTPase)